MRAIKALLWTAYLTTAFTMGFLVAKIVYTVAA